MSLTIASWNGTRRACRPYNASRRDSHLVTRLIHPSRPPHFPAIRAMCLGYVRARCLYAWAFWEPKPAQVRALQAAFNQPMQRVLGLHSSSHHLGLLAEAHCPSFEALRTQAAACFLLRAEDLLQTDPRHPTARALVLDRARAAAYHCRGHTKSRITVTVTNFAEATAMPHLIHNVFTRLPALAPLHPLTACYFPSQPVATIPPLPTSLTIDQVNSLLMVDTHREWRAPPTLRGVSNSTAPLLTIKTSPALSLYLRVECNPMVASELVSEPTAPTLSSDGTLSVRYQTPPAPFLPAGNSPRSISTPLSTACSSVLAISQQGSTFSPLWRYTFRILRR